MSLKSRNTTEYSQHDLPNGIRYQLQQFNQHIKFNQNEVSCLRAKRLESLALLQARKQEFAETQSQEAGALLQQQTSSFIQIEVRLKRLSADLEKTIRQRDLLLKQHQLMPNYLKDNFIQDVNEIPLST